MSRFLGLLSFENWSVQRKILISVAVLVGGGILAGVGYLMFPTPTSQNVGYGPDQPIPFSHRLHAGTLKMECRYCHTGAYKSVHATIPSLNVCMNCHSVVRLDSPHIQNLRKHFADGKPVEWIRVHELPDHVRFNHKRHVLKGVKCETCHGDVREMDVITQQTPLNMGWCLSCHRGQTTPDYVRDLIYPGAQDKSGPVAPFNCATCHY
jgi:hypothetical protein